MAKPSRLEKIIAYATIAIAISSFTTLLMNFKNFDAGNVGYMDALAGILVAIFVLINFYVIQKVWNLAQDKKK